MNSSISSVIVTNYIHVKQSHKAIAMSAIPIAPSFPIWA
jgi:hypothetical protein